MWLQGGKVGHCGRDAKACAWGQAPTSVTAQAVSGRTPHEWATARDQLRAMLKDNGDVPDAPFDGFDVLGPARDFRNRHASILLAIEAAAEAAEQAAQQDCVQTS